MSLKVSICMITFNHENFIKQAIDSVLIQKTNFDYELVIGEDCSTDKTREIVIDYQKLYPAKIKLLLPKKNLGMTRNLIRTLKACKGEFVALLEGDDYWSSPYKLHKQVNFLEKHPDFAICFHNTRILQEDTGNKSRIAFTKNTKNLWTIEELLRMNFIPTLTCMFRNNILEKFPKWYYDAFPGDWPLHIFNAQKGKIWYLSDIMSTYRIHAKGATSGSSPVNNNERYINTLENLKSNIDFKYIPLIDQTISKLYLELSNLYLKKNELKKARSSFKKCLHKNFINPVISKKKLLSTIFQLYFPKIYKFPSVLRKMLNLIRY